MPAALRLFITFNRKSTGLPAYDVIETYLENVPDEACLSTNVGFSSEKAFWEHHDFILAHSSWPTDSSISLFSDLGAVLGARNTWV